MAHRNQNHNEQDVRPGQPRIERISAVTLSTVDLRKSLAFYQSIGFTLAFSSEQFATLLAGESRINLASSSDPPHGGWGRIILYVDDVDAWYRAITQRGIATDTEPRDADWHERYFHVTDPNGHQLSFAMPLDGE